MEPAQLHLISLDGTCFTAFAARAAEPIGAGVVILPDIRGLTGFYEELARGFAAAGVDAIAIDYFGRQNGARTPPPEFDPMAAFASITADQVSLDAAAAADHLRATGPKGDPIFTVGFCIGGRIAYLNATSDSPIGAAGTVALYGVLRPWHPAMPAPIDRADRLLGPILGLFGGADEVVPIEQVNAFDRALVSAGVDHEFAVYPGATHGFFDPSAEQFAAASEDAWRRVIEFISRQAAAG